MVTIVLATGSLVTGFNGKSVVVGRELRIDGRTPFPLNGYARGAVRTEGSVPIYGIDAADESAARHRPRQASKEYLIVSSDWHRRRPCIGQRAKCGGAAGSTWREDDLRIGDRQLILSSTLRKRNR